MKRTKFKKCILLTFDYELFLGNRSGSVANCLIKPTDKILELLNKYKAKAIFFIDTSYLFKLEQQCEKSLPAQKDFSLIISQLTQIASSGHYLFHHIHPHWIDAEYLDTENQWSLTNMSKYTFQSITEKERCSLFNYSSKILAEIIYKSQQVSYSNGYRAGGLFIDPFSSIKSHFIKHHIKYDFSVLPNEAFYGKCCSFDYRNCPSGRPYQFSENASKEDTTGEYYEFPISRLTIQGVYKIINAIYYRLFKRTEKHKPYGDGISAVFIELGININPPKKNYFSHDIVLSIESLNPILLHLYKQDIINSEFIHFLSHPKLVSTISLNQMDKLLDFCHKHFSVEYDFIKRISLP